MMQIGPRFQGMFVIPPQQTSSTNAFQFFLTLSTSEGVLYKNGIHAGYGGENNDQSLVVWGDTPEQDQLIKKTMDQYGISGKYTPRVPEPEKANGSSMFGFAYFSLAYVQELLQKGKSRLD